MKASDLMIGDYILAKPSMMPIQVAAVHNKKIGYHAVTHKLNWIRDGLLESIPITEEILEKNGFKGEDDNFFLWHEDLERALWFDDGYITVTSVKCDRMYEGNCYNVHELQHALKLCGIAKTIKP